MIIKLLKQGGACKDRCPKYIGAFHLIHVEHYEITCVHVFVKAAAGNAGNPAWLLDFDVGLQCRMRICLFIEGIQAVSTCSGLFNMKSPLY